MLSMIDCPSSREAACAVADHAVLGQARVVGAPGKARAAIENQRGDRVAISLLRRRRDQVLAHEMRRQSQHHRGFGLAAVNVGRGCIDIDLRQVERMDDAGIERDVAAPFMHEIVQNRRGCHRDRSRWPGFVPAVGARCPGRGPETVRRSSGSSAKACPATSRARATNRWELSAAAKDRAHRPSALRSAG